MFSCIYVCSPPMPAYCPQRSEAGTRFPGTGATTWVLGTRSSTRAVGVLNCWAISPAPKEGLQPTLLPSMDTNCICASDAFAPAVGYRESVNAPGAAHLTNAAAALVWGFPGCTSEQPCVKTWTFIFVSLTLLQCSADNRSL